MLPPPRCGSLCRGADPRGRLGLQGPRRPVTAWGGRSGGEGRRPAPGSGPRRQLVPRPVHSCGSVGGTEGHCLVRRPGHLSRQAPLASVLAGGICPPSPVRPASPRPPRAWRVWSCPRAGLTSGGARPRSVHKAAFSGLSAGPPRPSVGGWPFVPSPFLGPF